jgi:hypothetical protein
MKFGWTWQAEEAVPGIRTNPQNAGQGAVEIAKTDASKKRGEIRTEGKNGCTMIISGIHCDHEKNCDLREPRRNELRKS